MDAPAWTGFVSFPIPDPNKPAARTPPALCSHNPVIAQRTHNLGRGHERFRWALRLQSQLNHGNGYCHWPGQGSVACLREVTFSPAGLSVAVPSGLQLVHNYQVYSCNDCSQISLFGPSLCPPEGFFFFFSQRAC